MPGTGLCRRIGEIQGGNRRLEGKPFQAHMRLKEFSRGISGKLETSV
jgi:hypothetical protein